MPSALVYIISGKVSAKSIIESTIFMDLGIEGNRNLVTMNSYGEVILNLNERLLNKSI